MIFPRVALVLLIAVGCSSGSVEEKQMIKTPYRSESAYCYKRLKECNPLFQKTVADLLSIANQTSAFQDRLNQIITHHIETIEKSRTLPVNKPWKEEDVYLCCVFDLIEGLFGLEAERILSSSGDQETRRNGIQELKKQLEAIPISGPKWNQGSAVIIQKKLSDAENQIK